MGGAAAAAARLHGLTPKAMSRAAMRIPSDTALPIRNFEETQNMSNDVELRCWACKKPFSVEYGPGRRRRYCGPSCKDLARRIARRVRYVEEAELRRLAHTPPL